ncbi:MFS general substrate transporter [Mycena epipterygia]|nr:MFS general substrate transporter [Mycena epipterygia]
MSNSPPLAKETDIDFLQEEKVLQETSTEAENASSHTPDDFMAVPDGGLKAWTTIAGAWLVLFATLGYLHSFGVYEQFYVVEYLPNFSTSSISWIGSFQLTMPYALSLVSGKLFDNGHFYKLNFIGGALFIFSVFMLSLCKPHQYYQIFLSQGVGMGIGLGITFVPAASVVVHHFAKRRGLALGVALSGAAVGSTIFPLIINHLLPRIGFPQTVRATGYVILGTVVGGNALMRTRYPGSKRTGGFGIMKSFFTDPPYMWTVAGAALASVGFFFPLIFIQLYATQHSVDKNLAFYSLAILNGTSIFGRVAGNYLADLYGPLNVQTLVTFMTGGVIWAVLGVHNGSTLVVVSVLYGVLSGAWLSLAFACTTSLAKTPAEAGARTGLALALVSAGSLISAPIQGALLGKHFLWIRPIGFSGSLVFAGAICLAVARMLQARRHSTQFV